MIEVIKGSIQSRLIDEGIVDCRDLEVIDQLARSGYSVSVHGTAISGHPEERSDVDFAVIGPIVAMPDHIAGLLSIGDTRRLTGVDYMSLKVTGVGTGRCLSLHVQEPSFRNHYPTKPIALEYRSQPKGGNGKSKYIMSGMSRTGDYLLYQVTCPQTGLEGGAVVNATPQCGPFIFSENGLVPADPNFSHHVFPVEESILGFDIRTGEVVETRSSDAVGVTVWQWGVEASKLLSTEPYNIQDANKQYDFNVLPLQRVMLELFNFTGIDPITLIPLLTVTEARARYNGNGSAKVTDEFIAKLASKLQAIASS